MLNNKSYRDKTIAEFFDRNSEPAKLDGVVHSTRFRKINEDNEAEFIGREREVEVEVGTDANGNKIFEKVTDDVQFSNDAVKNNKGYNTKGVFNGSSYLNEGNGTALQITSDISFGSWFKIENLAVDGVIISKYQFTASNSRAWQLRFGSGIPQVYISDNGTLSAGHYKFYVAQPIGDVTDGNWHSVVATFKASTSTLKMYIDRLEVPTTKSRDDAITSIVNVTHPIYIGAISNGSPVTFLTGELRGTFVYDRELLASEILAATNPYLLPKDHVLFEDYGGSNVVAYSDASLSFPTKDVEDFPLRYKGKLAPRAQLVNAPALLLNGVDQKIQFNYQPITVFLDGVDDTSNWTIADIGGGNWTIAPTTAKTVYNLVINSTRQYPCSEGNGIIVHDVSGNGNHGTVTNPILPTIWTTQNVYHYSHVYGYWLYKDISDNEVKIPVDAGASVTIAAVTFAKVGFVKGSNRGNLYNGGSDLKLPNIPEIHSSIRGLTKTKDEWITFAETSDYVHIMDDGRVLVTNSDLTTLEKVRG